MFYAIVILGWVCVSLYFLWRMAVHSAWFWKAECERYRQRWLTSIDENTRFMNHVAKQLEQSKEQNCDTDEADWWKRGDKEPPW